MWGCPEKTPHKAYAPAGSAGLVVSGIGSAGIGQHHERGSIRTNTPIRKGSDPSRSSYAGSVRFGMTNLILVGQAMTELRRRDFKVTHAPDREWKGLTIEVEAVSFLAKREVEQIVRKVDPAALRYGF